MYVIPSNVTQVQHSTSSTQDNSTNYVCVLLSMDAISPMEQSAEIQSSVSEEQQSYCNQNCLNPQFFAVLKLLDCVVLLF